MSMSSPVPQTYGFGWQTLTSRFETLGQKDFLALYDAAQSGLDDPRQRPAALSAVLARCFDWADPRGDGAAAFDPMRLSMMDRISALFSISFKVGIWPTEFVSNCDHCNTPSELKVAPSEFTYAPAQAYVTEFEGGRFMQPNGYHERLVASGGALETQSLRISNKDAGPDLKAEDGAILSHLHGTGAQVTTGLPWHCASCGAENGFWFDPLDWIARHTRPILQDIHRLARAYGWSEEAILSLSPARRRAYARLIERDDHG